jgi:parallel beta-helix repeat protein
MSRDWFPPRTLSIQLGRTNDEQGLFLDQGGDVDTEVSWQGSPLVETRRTGNGQVLPSPDGNQIEDRYMQFRADDRAILAGAPTTRLRVEIEYFDKGTDRFTVQYDALSGGPLSDGRFKDTGSVVKTNTWRFQTAAFTLCDAYFGNRDNGADFRIADGGDGAEAIRRVTVTLLPPVQGVISVDSCGADPWDNAPDSDAIQACVDQACDGDTIVFTSGVNSANYRGYMVDKTVFLVATTAKRDLTFTSTDPANHALLRATSELKGFVVRLFARSRVRRPGEIDGITISHLSLDGGRDVRICNGADGVDDGVGDNWGSWLPECSEGGDAWCSPGGLGMDGTMEWADVLQNYAENPDDWSTGLMVDDLQISQTECGTALSMAGAACTIRDCLIETAGDHVHGDGCQLTDDDEPVGAWSDGITFTGPDHLIAGNTISDASDVGIVFFGGRNTIVRSNTVRASRGNYGMFAGIAIHPWTFGDVSGVQVVGNQVINQGDTACGGIHAGINIGTHMWVIGCVWQASPSAVGNPGSCVAEPAQPMGTLCTGDELCQEWAHVSAGQSFTLRDNYVSGAQVNYLIEGLDLVGTLVESGNSSGSPRMTDWEDDAHCRRAGEFDSWGMIDRAAHHPTLPGWTDQRIHCAR